MDYSRDNQGRVTAINTTKGGNTQTVANNIDYLPFGPVSGLTYGNGLSLTDSYDQDYRLARTQCNVLDLQFTYDAASNITDIDNHLDGSRNQDFSYDALYRLTSADGTYGNLSYSYDKVGNRTSKSSNTQSDSYSYANTSHRLNGISGSNSEIFSYDNAGNTTQSNAGGFTYNAANRLSEASTNQGNANYTYNGRGERVIKANNLTTRIYHYNQSGNLIAETDQNGNTISEYIYLDGQRIALVTSRVPANDPLGLGGTITSNTPELFFIHSDHLNTPQVITDANRQVVWQADYTPFGTTHITTQLIANNLRFPGQYYDAETGNNYNYFRDYNPTIGRYIESDPIGLSGGINTYQYSLANPVNYFDPDGETPISVLRGTYVAATRAGTFVNSAIEAATGLSLGVIIYEAVNECEDTDDPSCDEHFTKCLDTSLAGAAGGNFGSGRCGLCRDTCEQNGGEWQSMSHTGDRCDYWNF